MKTSLSVEPSINPGTMRFRVVLRQPVVDRAADGSELQTWNEVATVRAAIDFGEGREYFSAKAVNAEMTHLITIYAHAGIDSTWSLKFLDGDNPRFLDIRAVKPLGTMRRYQRLECRELVGREVTT